MYTNDHTTTTPDSRYEHARDLALRYGWNATAFQIVNPGITLYFDSQEDAVVGYVTKNGVRVVAGAPVCAENVLESVIAQFEADAAKNRQRVCYFGAAERVIKLLGHRPGYSSVVLGAQPVWSRAPIGSNSRRHQCAGVSSRSAVGAPSSACSSSISRLGCGSSSPKQPLAGGMPGCGAEPWGWPLPFGAGFAGLGLC